jgi:eukaryotic sulfide quinone oxidoreductase
MCSLRTLVGAGLGPKTKFRRPLDSLIPRDRITHIHEDVKSLSPSASTLTTTSGRSLGYEALVVAAGLKINWNAISGLEKALAEPLSGVSSIYSYNTCDKAWKDIESLRTGKAIFTQPAGIIKCAGGQYFHHICHIRCTKIGFSHLQPRRK